jgi:CRISPR-associated endonuclease/helicase Cas3
MKLLAKPNEDILEHTENTLRVFRSIRQAYSEIPIICGVDQFWEHLFCGLFLHDFGKAITGFQNIFVKGELWNYRHEILSAGFIECFNIPKIYSDSIALAIITHHKDILELRERYTTISPTGKDRFLRMRDELKPNLNELKKIWKSLPTLSERYLGFQLSDFDFISSVEELKDVYKDVIVPYYYKWAEGEKLPNRKYNLFLKGFLTACDHLASAGKYEILTAVRDIKSIYKFPRLRKIQEKALKTRGDTLLIAPIGSGKTEAALFWCHSNQNPQNSKRIFYILPYVASINAMYERLVKDFNDDLVGVLHGKSSYFLYKAFSDQKYEVAVAKARAMKSLTKKIYRPYKILTPFQILKTFFGIKGFEQQFSEITNGLFVFDEIHAYDPHTTALILEMLKILKNDYHANFLVMSATLPSFIKQMLQKVLDATLISLQPKELKKFTRHEINILEGDIFSNIGKIKQEIKSKRILVVCNTVSQAQLVFRELLECTKNCALLHGRFILKDRERIEKNINDLDLLVGTQAIEVSLDIDYDVLYTEPAPIDALIQRFGRVNRRGWESNKISPIFVFDTGSDVDNYIYNENTVNKTIDLLVQTDLLEEQLVQEFVDNIYRSGYQGKNKREFDTVKRNFSQYYKQIVPFIHQKDSEDVFYRLFKSIEVVPLQYKESYLDLVHKSHYLEAMKFFATITLGQYAKLRKEHRIEKIENTLFVDVPYDTRLGLVLKEIK